MTNNEKNRISENNAYKLLCRQWFWRFLCSTHQLLVGHCEWNVLHQSNSDWWLNNEQWFHCFFILVMLLELSSLMSHKFLLLIKMWYDINYGRSYNTELIEVLMYTLRINPFLTHLWWNENLLISKRKCSNIQTTCFIEKGKKTSFLIQL